MEKLAKKLFANVAKLKFGGINVTVQKCFDGKVKCTIISGNAWCLTIQSLVQYISVSLCKCRDQYVRDRKLDIDKTGKINV